MLEEVRIEWFSDDFSETKIIHTWKNEKNMVKPGLSDVELFTDHNMFQTDGRFVFIRSKGESSINIFDLRTMKFSAKIAIDTVRVPVDSKHVEECIARFKKARAGNTWDKRIPNFKTPDYYPLITKIAPLFGDGILVKSATGPAEKVFTVDHTGKPIHTIIKPEYLARLLAKDGPYYWVSSYDGDQMFIDKVGEGELEEFLANTPYADLKFDRGR